MDQIDKIAQEFRDSLKSLHQDEFENITMVDMQKEICEKQAMRDKTNNMINMSRLRMFIDGMASFENVLLLLEFPGTERVMSTVWGSVKFMLRITDTTDKALDGVLEEYQRLGAHLTDLTRYTDFFQTFQQDAVKCLVNIFQDVQRFHSLAYKLFSLAPQLWQRLQKPIWEDSARRFKRVSESLNTHREFIKSHSNSSPGILFQSKECTIADLNTGSDDEDIDADFQRYFYSVKSDWTSFEAEEDDPSGKMQRLQNEFRSMAICPNSGHWLFRKYSAIAEWMGEEEPPDSAIWLHGNFGYGKTVLASMIVDELQPKEEGTSRFFPPIGSRTSYFYCEKDDHEHRNHLDILKGILLQMVESEDYILPLCNQERITSGGVNLIDVRVTQKLIKTFIEYCPRQYVIVDGLDECKSIEIDQIARFFKDLVSKYDTSIRSGHLRVMFIGRETSDTRRHIRKDDYISIELKEHDNQDDIREFVRKKLPLFYRSNTTRGFSLSDADKADIERIICHQSNDSFLYAHLAIEYLLQQDTKREILDLLKHGVVPAKLGDLYESLLDSVKKRLEKQSRGDTKWQRTKLLFGWLVCAKRQLTWHEMQAILCFDQVEFNLDLEGNMMRHDIEHYLGSIVHVLDGEYIRLVHSTARTHLVQNKHIKEGEIQCQLATTCLRYLSLPCFSKGYESTERVKHARLGWFAFQDYACSQWLRHVDTVLRDCRDLFVGEPLGTAREFISALVMFVNIHRTDLTEVEHSELDVSNIERFHGRDSYSDIRLLWNHIFTHQKGDFGARNTIGIAQIETALQDNRTEVERLSPSEVVGDEDTVESYYEPEKPMRNDMTGHFNARYLVTRHP
ncbi:early growth response 1-B [Fusarium heterosporum]|uniref:Early growth response 1-B n=1 Tax=Fusarium heterosporum TaxID=42747 RepID=A0A8H5T619_FUSHE|nr:early growth response 1-B [Fusarium heterosporum]